jgi:hypothetical protein
MVQVYGEPSATSSIGYNISYTRQQLISSLMTLGAFISSFSAGKLNLNTELSLF